METGIASRRQARIDREVMTVHWSGGHGESSIARVRDVLYVLPRTRRWGTIWHSMGRQRRSVLGWRWSVPGRRWSIAGRIPRRRRDVLKLAAAGVLMVTGRYVEAIAGESTHGLLGSRVLRGLEMRRRFMVMPDVTSFMSKTPLSPAGLESLLLQKPVVRDRLAGGGFPVVRRTSTLGGLVPIQFGDDILLHPVPLVFIQLAAFDALAAEVHVAVLAFLDTINVALVAEVAPHGPDDGKLESSVGSHRISRERSLY